MLIPGQQKVYADFCVGIELCGRTLPMVVQFVYKTTFFITKIMSAYVPQIRTTGGFFLLF